MKKLERLKLKDVLSHVETEVAIAPCLTVFAGESNSGKSSVIRGLYQAMCNQPAGIDLLRHSAKRGACAETTVEGVDDTGAPFTVLRRRGNSRNEYEVNGDMLKAFGLGVPSEVQKVLNLSPNSFQLQSDGHFLLKETDGEVARILGRTVGLNDIDAAFGHIRKIKAENDTTLRIAESDVQRETEASARYDGVDEALRCVESFEGVVKDYNRLSDLVCSIEAILNQYRNIPETIDMAHIECLLKRVHSTHNAVIQLESKVKSIIELRSNIENLPKPVRTFAASTALNKLLSVSEKCKNERDRLQNMQNLKQSIDVLPETVEIEIVQDAILCLKEIGQKQDEKNLRRKEMENVLSSLKRCCVVDEHDIEIATGKVESLKLQQDNIKSINENVMQIDHLIKSIAAIEHKIDCTKNDCKDIQSAIEMYIKENPVCPECGAQQKHWRKV